MYYFRRKLLIVDNARPTRIIESEHLKVSGVHGHTIIVGGPVELEFQCSNLVLPGSEPITITFKHGGAVYSIEKCMKHHHYNRRQHVFTGLFCEPWSLESSIPLSSAFYSRAQRKKDDTTQRDLV